MAEVKNINRIDTGDNGKDTVAGFPSHLIDPWKKQQPEWCLKFIRGMHTANSQMNIMRSNISNYKQWRDYARGKQEIDQYKEMLSAGKKRNRGKRNQSWRNLDHSIMPIAPKFVRILEGMIMKQKRIVKTKGIDNESLDAERTYESKLAEWVFNRDFLESVKVAMPNAQVNSPVAAGDPQPMTMADIPLYKDIYYKDRNALELKDVIDTVLEVNKMDEQGRRDCVIDLIEIGMAATKTFVDNNGFLKSRRAVPERMISNQMRKNDGGDISWCGEYVEMTIQELKQEAGDEFTEDQYREIANQHSNKQYTNNFTPTHLEEDVINYPYDNERITVLDAEWFSVDTRTTKVSKDQYGNRRSERVKLNYLPKGVSDDMYKEEHKGERYLMRRNVKNVYRGKWIVNTDFIYKYGLQTDMIRAGSQLEDCKLTYSIHTTGFDSLIRMIIPILDQIQINWLQFQNHVARSRPSGLSIEMSALANLTLGKGNERMTPKEALRIYMDTGILVWRRKDWGNASNQWKPIEELKNGIGEAAAQHFNNILGMIDMLRNIIGINEVSDASTPNPDIGKFVTESAMVATQSAVNYLYDADRKLYEETCEKIALLLPDLIKRGKSKAFINALGLNTYNFYKKNIDLTRYQFSTKIEVGYSDEQRAIVQKYMEVSLQGGEITPEDAIKIENEENPHKQAAMLRQAKIEKQEREQAAQQALAEMEAQKNAASTQASAEAEIAKETKLSEVRKDEDAHKSLLTIQEQNNLVKGQIIVEKVKAGLKLTEQEEQFAASLIEEELKSKTAITVANINKEAAKSRATQSGGPNNKPKPKARA